MKVNSQGSPYKAYAELYFSLYRKCPELISVDVMNLFDQSAAARQIFQSLSFSDEMSLWYHVLETFKRCHAGL